MKAIAGWMIVCWAVLGTVLGWGLASAPAWSGDENPTEPPSVNGDATSSADSGWSIPIYTREKAPQASKAEQLEQCDRVSQYGITWTFDKKAPVGRFVNGDWYVVGPVTITTINPKSLFGDEVTNPDLKTEAQFKGQYARNGSVLNLVPKVSTTGFDSRTPHHYFKPEMFAKLPIAMKPGDSLVSSISKATTKGTYPTPVQTFAVLTCLAQPVPADTFRPGYTDRTQKMYRASDLRRELLPNLACPEKASDIKASQSAFARLWHEVNLFDADQAPYQAGGYGRATCEKVARASLQLMMDFKPVEKEPLLVGFVQFGIDLAGLLRAGHPGWTPPIGGWRSGRKWPIVFAGILLGDDELANPNKTFPNAAFGEEQHVMYDDCWTGAGVVYAGHLGIAARTQDKLGPGWGEYENKHPSRWVEWIGTSYRGNMTSSTWVGEALAIRILNAEKEWNCPVFLDYCDRWMYEPDPGFHNPFPPAFQGATYDPMVKALWTAYREKLPKIPGRECPPRPTDGWKKTREMKSVPVELGKKGEFNVKGAPFFPIMVFAQHPKRIPDVLAIGANTVAEGSFEPSEEPDHSLWLKDWQKGGLHNAKFLDELAKNGLYGIFGADARVIGHPALLGIIHKDRPDQAELKKRFDVSGVGCQENKGQRHGLEDIFDGDGSKNGRAWINPLKDAQVTVRVRKPITVAALTVSQEVTSIFSAVREASFLADGQEILKTTLEDKLGVQKFDLAKPVTLKELTFKVLSTYPAKEPGQSYAKQGTIFEIEALNSEGKPIPLFNNVAEPGDPVSKKMLFNNPDMVKKYGNLCLVRPAYEWMKARDASRPAFMSLTPAFMKESETFEPELRDSLYPGFLTCCEAAGCGPMPIEQMRKALSELRSLAGPSKALFAWIETRGVKPETLLPQVRMAIASGATAIGYRGFEGYGNEKPDAAVMAELKRINDQITGHAAELLADPGKAESLLK